ncbi:MotA/TolQ/ExbB proton channel family protein [Telmatospirillum sp. J64-1]|uniref:MotA/TolQ/ExbB proton channel family protein n=1 Tax=Telmatospirillum sp. J64-1 TaxID=2502183 RepID=UPI0021078559|nr:MotA/TolQ/ExbB proton channel family protein [Telmatospirillum sp. J64-1]
MDEISGNEPSGNTLSGNALAEPPATGTDLAAPSIPSGPEAAPAGLEGGPTGLEGAPAGLEGAPAGLDGAPAGLDLSAPVPTGAELSGFDKVLDLMAAGGPIMYVLAALSILAAALVVMKVIQFTLARAWGNGTADRALELWHGGRGDEALPVLEAHPNPVARVLDTAIRGRLRGTLSEEKLREETTRVAGLQLDELKSGLRFLALVATLSPLLGLLGTVMGMIDAFQALEGAGNRVDPSILSGGIWVALLTTAAGLVVAIPAAAAHHWLEGVVDRIARRMEDSATQVFTHTPAENLFRGQRGLALQSAE